MFDFLVKFWCQHEDEIGAECLIGAFRGGCALLSLFLIGSAVIVQAINQCRGFQTSIAHPDCKPLRHLHKLKVCFAAAFSLLQIIEIVVTDKSELHNLVASALLSGVGFCSIFYSYQFKWSSALQTFMWTITIMMPSAMGMIYKHSSLLGIQFCVAAALGFIHGITASHPCDSKSISPQEWIGVLSKITQQWSTKIVIAGYKGTLKADDISPLRNKLKSERNAHLFYEQWDKILTEEFETLAKNVPKKSEKDGLLDKQPQISKLALLKALWRTFGTSFLQVSGLKLGSDCFKFFAPKLLGLLLRFIDDPTQERPIGYIIALAFFIASLMQTLLENVYFENIQAVAARTRGALISAIFRQSLYQDAEAKSKHTIGSVVNLMSVDNNVIMGLMTFINVVWSAPFQIIVGTFFLYQEIGVASLAGVFSLFGFIFPINFIIGRIQRKLNIEQMKIKDDRIKVTNEVLGGIKVIKLYGWEDPFESKIAAIRQKELANMRTSAIVDTIGSMTWNMAPVLVTFISFMVYILIDENNVLSIEKIFVCLVLFGIIQFPIVMLPVVVNWTIRASVSMGRIQSYLSSTKLDNIEGQHDSKVWMKTENASFTWGDKDSEPNLHNMNIEVKEGELIAIVGTVGSGKSSLIHALLGSMRKTSGKHSVSGSLAYVPQEAWIRNATVRNNVLFGTPFNKDLYEKVLQLTGMDKDMHQFQFGDQTIIGEKGVALSGGQRQRVSIARSIYSTYYQVQSTIYLFDDPLSALDAHVSKHVFSNVIGPKSILEHSTRILVTNALHLLPQVNRIYVIDDGRIVETGTFQQLKSGESKFSDILREYTIDESMAPVSEEVQNNNFEEEEDLADIYADQGQTPMAPHTKKPLIRQMSKLSDDVETSGPYCRKPSRARHRSSSAKTSKKSESDVKENELEKVKEGTVKAEVFKNYFNAVGVLNIVLVFVFYIGAHACGSGADIWLSKWDDGQSDLNLNSTKEVQKYAIGRLGVYAAIGASKVVLTVTASITMTFAALIASSKYHKALLSKILAAPMSFFDTTPLGNVLNRIGNDINNIDTMIPGAFLLLVNLLVLTSANLVVIVYTMPWFTLVMIPVMIVFYLLQRFFVATSRQIKRIESKAKAPIYSNFQETIHGQTSIRAFDKITEFEKENALLIDKHHQAWFMGIVTNRWLSIRLDLLNNLVVVSACIFAVIGRDQLAAGLVGLCVTYTLRVTQTLNYLIRQVSQVEANIVSVERVEGYIKDLDQEKPRILDTDEKLPTKWPACGKIEIRKFSARYRAELPYVIKDVSCMINAGEKIGICGRTGAGKSSLTVALFRLIESDQGKIFIDDVDIATIGLNTLRSHLSIIPQEPVLFDGTLRENVDPWAKSADEDLWKVLEESHLKSFLTKNNFGLDMVINEGGDNLSVGQRQLVCLARAILANSSILVLDEATAAMDMETDALIQQTIRTKFANATTVTIAHRINTIMDSTKILVLDNGAVAEFDTPENLLKDENSIFKSMVHESGLDN